MHGHQQRLIFGWRENWFFGGVRAARVSRQSSVRLVRTTTSIVLRQQYSQPINISEDGYVFKSQTFLLGWTQEKVQLPHRSRLAARVEGKSSLARLGIGVHVTAPTIHAGFGYKKDDSGYPGSPLQLEMWNVGPLDVKLVEGMRICQLIFELVDGTPEKATREILDPRARRDG